jgi:hypothetical protein
MRTKLPIACQEPCQIGPWTPSRTPAVCAATSAGRPSCYVEYSVCRGFQSAGAVVRILAAGVEAKTLPPPPMGGRRRSVSSKECFLKTCRPMRKPSSVITDFRPMGCVPPLECLIKIGGTPPPPLPKERSLLNPAANSPVRAPDPMLPFEVKSFFAFANAQGCFANGSVGVTQACNAFLAIGLRICVLCSNALAFWRAGWRLKRNRIPHPIHVQIPLQPGR